MWFKEDGTGGWAGSGDEGTFEWEFPEAGTLRLTGNTRWLEDESEGRMVFWYSWMVEDGRLCPALGTEITCGTLPGRPKSKELIELFKAHEPADFVHPEGQRWYESSSEYSDRMAQTGPIFLKHKSILERLPAALPLLPQPNKYLRLRALFGVYAAALFLGYMAWDTSSHDYNVSNPVWRALGVCLAPISIVIAIGLFGLALWLSWRSVRRPASVTVDVEATTLVIFTFSEVRIPLQNIWQVRECAEDRNSPRRLELVPVNGTFFESTFVRTKKITRPYPIADALMSSEQLLRFFQEAGAGYSHSDTPA